MLLKLLLLFLTAGIVNAAPCQAPFTDRNGVCLLVDSVQRQWCDAAAACRAFNGELVTDPEKFKRMRQDSVINVWVGVTDLLDERGTSKTGWQVTNGSLLSVSTADNGDWKSGYPTSNFDSNDFVGLKLDGLFDSRHVYTYRAACQPIETPNSPRFEQVEFLKRGNISPHYCYTDLPMEHKVGCLLRCRERWECRAALYSESLATCRMLDFADASAGEEIEKSGLWGKFRKVYS